MAASQDYRDGAAFGSTELAYRLGIAASFGLKLSPAMANEMAAAIVSEMGGHAGTRTLSPEPEDAGATS